jgi:hypothetical protein
MSKIPLGFTRGVNTTFLFWLEDEGTGIGLTYDPFSDVKLVLIKSKESSSRFGPEATQPGS